jgi:hypothetical protein
MKFIRTIFFVFTILVSTLSLAHTQDSITQNLKGDLKMIGQFKDDLMSANIVYVGDVHNQRGKKYTPNEIFHYVLVPSMIVMGFESYYLESLPAFNAEFFNYPLFYSQSPEQRKTDHDFLVNYAASTSLNKEPEGKLVNDLLTRGMYVYGIGDANLDQTYWSNIQRSAMMADHSVKAVQNEMYIREGAPKMVVVAGCVHNDKGTHLKKSDGAAYVRDVAEIVGNKIQDLEQSQQYLAVDIMPLSYLDKPDVKEDPYFKRYETLMENIREEVQSRELPTLIKVEQGSDAELLADYVIFIP